MGIQTPYETLRRYSGLDGDETLSIVAPQLNPQERKQLKHADGKRYEKFYLPDVKPFPGVRDLFQAIKSDGGFIALATDCKDPLVVLEQIGALKSLLTSSNPIAR